MPTCEGSHRGITALDRGFREADLRGNRFQPQDRVIYLRPANSFLVPLPKWNLCLCRSSLFWNFYPLGLGWLAVLQFREHSEFMQMPQFYCGKTRITTPATYCLLESTQMSYSKTQPLFLGDVSHFLSTLSLIIPLSKSLSRGVHFAILSILEGVWGVAFCQPATSWYLSEWLLSPITEAAL